MLDHYLKGNAVRTPQRGSHFPCEEVYLIGSMQSGLLDYAAFLNSRIPVSIFSSFVSVERLAVASGDAAMFFIDLDVFDDLAEAVTVLMNFRRLTPVIPTVIVSHSFKRCDFSTERMYLADVSLRLPSTSAALDLALELAPKNFSYFRRNRVDPVVWITD